MSQIADTPILGRLWCQGCEPEADPLLEILRTHWCNRHAPSLRGVAWTTATSR